MFVVVAAGVVVRAVAVVVAAVFVRVVGVVVVVARGVGVPKMSAIAEFVGVLEREVVVRVVGATGGVAALDPAELVRTVGGLLRAFTFTAGAVLVFRAVGCVAACALGWLAGGLLAWTGGSTLAGAPLCTTTIAPGLFTGAVFCAAVPPVAEPFSTVGLPACCEGGF